MPSPLAKGTTMPDNVRQWLVTACAGVTIALLGWVGASMLQSLAFQSAMAPQITSMAQAVSDTRKSVHNIETQLPRYVTKDELAVKIDRLEAQIQSLDVELAKIKARAGLE